MQSHRLPIKNTKKATPNANKGLLCSILLYAYSIISIQTINANANNILAPQIKDQLNIKTFKKNPVKKDLPTNILISKHAPYYFIFWRCKFVFHLFCLARLF